MRDTDGAIVMGSAKAATITLLFIGCLQVVGGVIWIVTEWRFIPYLGMGAHSLVFGLLMLGLAAITWRTPERPGWFVLAAFVVVVSSLWAGAVANEPRGDSGSWIVIIGRLLIALPVLREALGAIAVSLGGGLKRMKGLD